MPNKSFLTNRLNSLRQKLFDHHLDGLIITIPANLTYLTNVAGLSIHDQEALCLVTADQFITLVSPLKIDSFPHSIPGQILPLSKDHPLSHFLNQLPKKTLIGFEADHLTVNQLEKLKQKTKITLKPTTGIVEVLRRLKDKHEIKLIQRACRISVKTWDVVKPQIQPGISERQLTHLISQTQIELGADGHPAGFEPIAAFGPHSAIPHHTPTSTKLETNQIVLVDFGASVGGYASDMTRTFVAGKPNKLQTKLLKLVHQAYDQAMIALKPGVAANHIDALARNVIGKAGFAEQFIHSTGHALGLSIHESPSISPGDDTPLQENMIITIEPGIYLPTKFGIRHENTILITKSGTQTLT